MAQPDPLRDRDPQAGAGADRRPPVRVFRPEAEGQAADPLGVGGLFEAARTQPVDDLAERERIKAGLRGLILSACPDLAEWVAVRAAELVAYGGHEHRIIEKALAALAARRKNRQKPPLANPGRYLHTVLADRFGAAWNEWHQAETD